MPLSNPSQFGDVETPSPIQDANAFLIESLRLIRIECGPRVALMASEVLGILSDNDGMDGEHLEHAVAEWQTLRFWGLIEPLDSLEIRLIEQGPIRRAIAELAIRNVLVEADDRFSLNPAVAALIGRDAA